MFLTTPFFEHSLPIDFGAGESRYWRGALLSTQAPWFLLSYKAGTGPEESWIQTAAVACENTLADLIETVGPDLVVGIQWLVPDRTRHGHWSMQEVVSVWLAAEDEQSDTGAVLFGTPETNGLVDAFLGAVRAGSLGRRLLVSLNRPSSPT